LIQIIKTGYAMESNVDMNVENSTKVNRCPLGKVLNPNLGNSLSNTLANNLDNNLGSSVDSTAPAYKQQQTSKHTLGLGKRSKVLLLKMTGLLFVGLAILGVVLPILPTTPFLLVAAACFAKSSPEMQKRLLANKTFGPLIHDWQQHRSIPRKAKRIALLTIVLSVCWSGFMLQSLWLSLLVAGLVTGPFIFLWRLPITR
jgi:uncharacterized membrane protein YbaN (DUF454 family)